MWGPGLPGGGNFRTVHRGPHRVPSDRGLGRGAEANRHACRPSGCLGGQLVGLPVGGGGRCGGPGVRRALLFGRPDRDRLAGAADFFPGDPHRPRRARGGRSTGGSGSGGSTVRIRSSRFSGVRVTEESVVASRAAAPTVVLAVVFRPSLWLTALGTAHRLAAPGWWKRRPFLPLPDERLWAFRMVTAYGNADAIPDGADVVSYLEWCRLAGRSPPRPPAPTLPDAGNPENRPSAARRG